ADERLYQSKHRGVIKCQHPKTFSFLTTNDTEPQNFDTVLQKTRTHMAPTLETIQQLFEHHLQEHRRLPESARVCSGQAVANTFFKLQFLAPPREAPLARADWWVWDQRPE
ncbi:hypothetical protein LRB11_16125, partial [Ectothiorhodospira haloalkaliphila]|uniref:hypothetical protein n=1 Tax=Ectothiorhodospira haloalkaliphila TaxID=421628 RepID=UPI001EE8CDAA